MAEQGYVCTDFLQSIARKLATKDNIGTFQYCTERKSGVLRFSNKN